MKVDNNVIINKKINMEKRNLLPIPIGIQSSKNTEHRIEVEIKNIGNDLSITWGAMLLNKENLTKLNIKSPIQASRHQ